MLEHRPVRRDPRILVVVPRARALEYAALDAWEVRGLGEIALVAPAATRLALARLVVTTRPSIVVTALASTHVATRALRLLAAVARAVGVPVVTLTASSLREVLAALPSTEDLARQYPELRLVRAPKRMRAVAVAAAVLSKLDLPSRRYAPNLIAHRSTRVVTRRARRVHGAHGPHRSSARRNLRRGARRRRGRAPRARE